MDIEVIKEQINLTKLAAGFDIEFSSGPGRHSCPFCKSTSSVKVVDNKRFKCYVCNKSGDIFDFVQYAGLAKTFYEAGQLIISKFNLEASETSFFIKKKNKGMLSAFGIYQKRSKDLVAKAEEYCISRGWKRTFEEGDFGISDDASLLTQHGMSPNDIQEIGLLRKPSSTESASFAPTSSLNRHKELFDNHLIFPIRSASGSIHHLQGRSFSPNATVRWLADQSTPPISKSLYNVDRLKSFNRDYAVIVEGVSDCKTLLEINEPCVATFSLTAPLVSFARDFSHCTHILACFDRDKYPLGHPRQGEYKSWSQVVPNLCELAIQLKIPFFTWMVPNISGVKDINDLFLQTNYDESVYRDLLAEQAKPLHYMAFKVLYFSKNKLLHSLLWSLHEAIPNQVEEDRLCSQVNLDFGSWCSYLKWLNS